MEVDSLGEGEGTGESQKQPQGVDERVDVENSVTTGRRKRRAAADRVEWSVNSVKRRVNP